MVISGSILVCDVILQFPDVIMALELPMARRSNICMKEKLTDIGSEKRLNLAT